jgi:hypothetical protein
MKTNGQSWLGIWNFGLQIFLQIEYKLLGLKSTITYRVVVQNHEAVSDKFNRENMYINNTFFPKRKY